MAITEEHLEAFATIVGGIVENKPLDEIVEDLTGGDVNMLLDQGLAPASSPEVREYVENRIVEEYAADFGGVQRDDGELYLVKRVYCQPDQYAAMGDAIRTEDTDKFRVLTAIGAEPGMIGYDAEEQGLAYTLTAADSAADALQKTEGDTDLPSMDASYTGFNAEDSDRLDELATDAFYHHQTEDFEAFFEELGLM